MNIKLYNILVINSSCFKKIYVNSIRFKKYKIDVLFKYHNCEKNAKNKYDLEFNVTFSPIMSLNVTG